MKNRLIMLPQPILVSTKEPIVEKSNDSFYSFETSKIYNCKEFHSAHSCYKIIAGIEGLPTVNLSLIAERIGWVDVEKLALQQYPVKVIYQDDLINAFDINFEQRLGFIEGFKAAQSLNEKKYSEEDVINAFYAGQQRHDLFEAADYIATLKPKEYQVEYTQEGDTIKVTKILS